MKISKRLKEVLDFLGHPYHAQEIDFEKCAYRDFGNGFDVEISGCNRTRYPFYVYVWDKRNGHKVVEKLDPIKTLPELKAKLEELEDKYQNSRFN